MISPKQIVDTMLETASGIDPAEIARMGVVSSGFRSFMTPVQMARGASDYKWEAAVNTRVGSAAFHMLVRVIIIGFQAITVRVMAADCDGEIKTLSYVNVADESAEAKKLNYHKVYKLLQSLTLLSSREWRNLGDLQRQVKQALRDTRLLNDAQP